MEDVTTDTLTEEQDEQVRATVKRQVVDPTLRGKDHVRLSKIWQTTQNIRSIKAELAAGYTFDYMQMTEMVNAMFSFINSVVDTSSAQAAEVKVEEVTP